MFSPTIRVSPSRRPTPTTFHRFAGPTDPDVRFQARHPERGGGSPATAAYSFGGSRSRSEILRLRAQHDEAGVGR
ncbi:MAG: hypothetical protein AVDCRST_MAG59-4955 [uncultured Thermomicrobiales bacterium]|uniref:Uncharacterized protein n=1 Tax=uncultured Thermomicrobiales bacterium TaxID=1645740 RepID=A0A6J4VT66_9BACT|nr:MAG: hypothetical protein AVDCRST_MAG59-4955 [uncultured Thermomicrobiales bacterium]